MRYHFGMRKLLIRGSIIFTACLFLLNGCFYFNQANLIFYPTARIDKTPADIGLKYENIYLHTTDKVRLHGWFIPAQDATKTVLFFHGNAGNISHRLASIAIFHKLKVNVFIIDYRGYGQSEGKPSEQGLYTDARASWDYLLNRGIKAKAIIIFGRSLGGAVAAQLASQVNPDALILESTFSSVRDQAKASFPVLSNLVVLRFKFDTATAIKNVRCPLLILHSPDDEIISFSHSEKIYANANHPKYFARLKGDHNSGFLRNQADYEKKLSEFIRKTPTLHL